jgi:hypothetical protein
MYACGLQEKNVQIDSFKWIGLRAIYLYMFLWLVMRGTAAPCLLVRALLIRSLSLSPIRSLSVVMAARPKADLLAAFDAALGYPRSELRTATAAELADIIAAKLVAPAYSADDRVRVKTALLEHFGSAGTGAQLRRFR